MFSFSGYRVAEEQRRGRQANAFHRPFTLKDETTDPNSVPSFLLSTYRHLYTDLSTRLHVDETILDYNYHRLFKCMQIMTNERIQRRFQTHSLVNGDQLPLSEYTIALEFYLQIDSEFFPLLSMHFQNAFFSSISGTLSHEDLFVSGRSTTFVQSLPWSVLS